MKTIGDKLESFSVQGVKPGFNHHEENGVSAFETLTEKSFPGKVEGHLLLAQGLHLRLPDRDRRLRQARRPVRGARRGPARRLDRQREFVSSAGAATAATSRSSPTGCFGDAKGSLVDQLGVRDRNEGVALRATFIVDPENVSSVSSA